MTGTTRQRSLEQSSFLCMISKSALGAKLNTIMLLDFVIFILFYFINLSTKAGDNTIEH